jgi:hypothetical protein
LALSQSKRADGNAVHRPLLIAPIFLTHPERAAGNSNPSRKSIEADSGSGVHD